MRVMKWVRALPASTSKSVVITTTCELKARFTWGLEMGESTDYQQVINDHYHEWINNSGSGGSAHPWRVGSWYQHLDGVSTTTSVVFILQESPCKCNSIVLQAQPTKTFSLCELEKVVNSCGQKASRVTCALVLVVFCHNFILRCSCVKLFTKNPVFSKFLKFYFKFCQT